MKRVTVGVVLFGTKYLEKSLKSLLDQDYENIEFVIRDQEEDKWTGYEWVKENMPEVFDKAKVEKAPNLWHSGGHNAIIRRMEGEIYFCVSNDMLYPRNFVSKIVKALEENLEFDVATCKLMRWDYENDKETNFIDSMGIGIKKNHYFYDLGQGEEDTGKYDEIEPFGVSGALLVMTKKALESIKFKDEYFDEFIHYKNDIDLSYRLRWAGNRVLNVSDVKVYHDRQVDINNHSIKTQVSNMKSKKEWVKKSSYLGDQVILLKDFSAGYSFWTKFNTKVYHFLKRIYFKLTVSSLKEEDQKIMDNMDLILKKKKALKRNVEPSIIESLMT